MSIPTTPDGLFHHRTARRVIGALAALALAGGLAAGPVATAAAARAAHAIQHVVDDLATMTGFAAALDAEHLADLLGGYPNVPGTGLRLGDLPAHQREAALHLVRSVLSADAWTELSALVDADAALDAAADGGTEWSPDEYHLALFGDPAGDFVLQFSTSQLLITALRQGDDLDVQPDVVA